jgi:HAMP domain-containing protein
MGAPAMTKHSSVTLGAHFKRAIAASFLTLTVAAAAAAFAIGFTGALNQSLIDPNSAPLIRVTALQRLDTALGYDGFLKTYRAFLAAADRTQGEELRRLADDADLNLSLFDRASTNERDRDTAASLRRLEAPFRRGALFAAGTAGGSDGLVLSAQLESDYSALKDRIAAAAEAANIERIDDLAQALVWAQGTSVGALSLLSMVLFALAWFLRERLIAPLEALRHGVQAAAAGAISEPLWGLERTDEIGAIARAADKLRQATAASDAARVLPRLHMELIERLAKGAVRLESDLAKTATATNHARLRIEHAGLRAAKASHTALEAADLARGGLARASERGEGKIDALARQPSAVIDTLVAAVTRLSDAATRLERQTAVEPPKSPQGDHPPPEDGDAAGVMETLAGGLAALENFARQRPALASDQLVALTAALLKAIERLNAVAHSIADSSDQNDARALG